MTAWLSFVALTFMWGCSFLAIRVAVGGIPPLGAAFFRILIASILLAALGYARRVPLPSSRRLVARLAGVGLLNFGIPWACLFWGEQYVAPALASILNSTVPIFVLIGSWMLLPDEGRSALKIAGVFLGFAGMVAIFAPSVGAPVSSGLEIAGMAAITLMSMSYALGSVFMKKLVTQVDVTWGVSIQGFAASAVLLGMSAGFEGLGWMADFHGKAGAVGAILYLAVFSTALAWLLFYRLLREWGPVRSSTVTFVMPFVAIAADWVYFRRFPPWNEWLGVFLILGGIYMIHLARTRADDGAYSAFNSSTSKTSVAFGGMAPPAPRAP